MSRHDVSVAVAGSGGAGAMTAGSILLRGAALAGHYGLMSRLSGSQVRGGEAAALLRLAFRPVEAQPDRFDLFCGIDWGNVDRFADEIPLGSESLILFDPKRGPIPPAIAASRARQMSVGFSEMAATIAGGRANMAATGFLGSVLGLPLEPITRAVRSQLSHKGESAIATSEAVLQVGFAHGQASGLAYPLGLPVHSGSRWLLSGNEAAAVGSLRGGVRFVAGYPITPATELAEWLSPALARLGGQFVQGEDELASVNLALGASFGGTPAMTVTSGPGFSLMVESIGLAVAAEVPLVVVDVMRSGPSTGIPTKTEQSDLNLAVFGSHGDAPRIVLSATSIADNLATTQWAVELSQALQVPVIVLSDQAMGQSYAVIDAPAPSPSLPLPERVSARTNGAYKRYALTASGVSPIALPGTPGCEWVGEGLTHNERGIPVSLAKDHAAQLEKRWRKLEAYDFGDRWAEVEGKGDLAVITWGSSVGPVREALARLADEGVHIRLIGLRVIAPFQRSRLASALKGVRRALIVEQNQSGQLYHYVRGWQEGSLPLSSYARPGPLPLRPQDLVMHLHAWSKP